LLGNEAVTVSFTSSIRAPAWADICSRKRVLSPSGWAPTRLV